jgi:DNA-binding MarR family transcriptional regulator
MIEKTSDKLAQVGRECSFFKMRKASRAITQIYDRFMKDAGLAPTQFSLLVALGRTGEITITRLAQILVMDRTTLSRNLRPLEREGLVRVVPGPDRRTRALALTPQGRDRLAKALPLWEQAQAHMARRLGPERWQGLKETLDATVDQLR